jgi:hypothetical protein
VVGSRRRERRSKGDEGVWTDDDGLWLQKEKGRAGKKRKKGGGMKKGSKKRFVVVKIASKQLWKVDRRKRERAIPTWRVII